MFTKTLQEKPQEGIHGGLSMKVLVACEYSGVVREAFRSMGHDAWSCDLLPPDDHSPYHIQGNVLDVLGQDWDLMIAHPPCTYLSKAGARWLHHDGKIDQERLNLGMGAKAFLLTLLNAPVPRIAVENPTPLKIFGLPEPTQVIQPYQFGHPYSKRTLLWLKNLPPLAHTKILTEYTPFLPSNTGGAKRGQKHYRGTARNWKEASTTFLGVAEAMADQWTRNPTF